MGFYRNVSDRVPARYILCFMMFTGFMATFLLRVNINLAIVAMVNSTGAPHEDLAGNSTNTCGRHHTDDRSREKTKEVPGDFHWSEIEQSVILSSFFWGYLFFQIPGGRVSELFGTKKVFGLSVLSNGLLSLLIPTAASLHWSLLLIIRALQGLGQGVVFPCLSAAVARWVPMEERARFISFAIQGASLGTVVALPLCGWVLTNWGWPCVFYVSGAIALVWYAAWSFLIYDSPQEHPRISMKERQFLEDSLVEWQTDRSPVPWMSMFCSLQFWVGVSAGVGNDWGFHMFCNFGPKFIKSALGFDLEKSSWLSSLPFLSQYIFATTYSFICDALLQRNVPTITIRKASVVVSHVLPAFGLIGLTLVGCDVTLSVIILTFSVSVLGALSCGYFQNPLDIAPNFAGSITGVTNAIGALTAVISTPISGAILQSMGSPSGWHVVFGISAVVYFLSSLPYLLLANGKLQPWNDLDGAAFRNKGHQLQDVRCSDNDETEALKPKKTPAIA